MNQPLDEAQLLALIEDQLDANAAKRVRDELADKPELLGQIDRMRADRAAVRDLPEPALSRDLLEALEPALARPMLLAPLSAAEYRKSHSRAPRPRFAKLALAAAVLLAMMAGVWAATSGLLRREAVTTSDMLTTRTTDNADDQGINKSAVASNTIDPAMVALAPTDRVTVHHFPPPTDVRTALADMHLGTVAANSTATIADESASAPATAKFALVIETADVDSTIDLLSSLIEPSKANAALVRNATEDEVIAYGHALAVRAGASQPGAPRMASADETPEIRLSELGLDHGKMPIVDKSLPEIGKHIAGESTCAATIEEQLQFADSGAQYALTIPADHLAELLLAVNTTPGQFSTLRTVDTITSQREENELGSVSMELQWLLQLREIQESLSDIDRATHADIVLPVRIEARPARKR